MTNLFAPTGSLSNSRGGDHTATLLLDGRVLIAGGTNLGPAIIEIPQAELYDPFPGMFTAAGDLVVPRSIHGAATLLTSGQVLLVGGFSIKSGYLATAELYDPATGSFSLAGNMAAPRVRHVQVRLSSGAVLVAGGSDGSLVTSTAELLYP